MEFMLLAIVAVVVFVFFVVLYLVSRYKRCPSDRVLVVYGKVGTGRAARCIHGGAALVWPVIQDYQFLSLTPITINIPLQNALSFQNIRINVPSTFTVAVSTDAGIMTNAAERLLRLPQPVIEDMAREIIFGQLRLTVASLTIEQINQDRESFLEAIRKNVEPELNKIGLYLINVNVTDITDESDYIVALGRKAAAEAINQAKIDVADQEKHGAIGEAEANREKVVRVAENEAEADKGKKKAEADRRIYVQGQEASAIDGENKAKADIADYEATLAVKRAAAYERGEVAKREAVVAVQKAEYQAEVERLTAEEVSRQEIDKRKVEIAADAEAEKRRREARGEADAILLKYEAEAKGILQVLQSKAEGYSSLVRSCANDARAAGTLLMIEKLEEIVSRQVEAIKNLKIDKVVVWDSAGGDGRGSSTANFVSSLVKSLPPLHDVAELAGVELPGYLGRMAEEQARQAAGKPQEPPSGPVRPSSPGSA
jgi:flotillin